MDIDTVVETVEGSILSTTAVTNNHTVIYGFSSDLMSDVLTVTAERVLLITGLSNAQTVRTAMMSDIHVILVGRNKRVTAEMKALAQQNDIILIGTSYSVFRASSELYNAGLKPVF